MKRLKMKRIALGTALAATLSVAIAIPVLAQGGPPPGPGGFGGPGGPGGPGGRPLALGAVQSVDTSARTITLSDPRGGSHTIRVASDAKIVGDKAISVSDLNVGDKIQVRGRPSVITADSIFAGGPGADMPPAGPPAGAQGPGAFGPPPGGPQGFGPGPDFGPPGGPGRIGNPNGIVVETGTVTKLNPLTISFGGGRTLTVELSPSAKVHTAGAMKLSDIKKGDRVAADVRPQGDGSPAAVHVSVNMPFPPQGGRFGRGGPGQAGAGPGFGPGPGGPGGGFGPGGFAPQSGGPAGGFAPQDGPGAPQDMPPAPGGDFGPGAAGPDGPPADTPDGSSPDL